MTTSNVELLPLPEWMSNYTIPADGFEHDEDVMLDDRMHDYARANMELLLAENERMKNMALMQTTRASAAERETEALRAEVERMTRCLANANAGFEEFERRWYLEQDRAERLAEALRDARDYVTTALREEREKFAGHEDCSDIPGIEADLHKIDSALNPTAAQDGK